MGQSPPKEPGPLSYFQPGSQVTTMGSSDPFANVRQPVATSSYSPMQFSSPAPPETNSMASQSFNAPPVGVPPTSQNFPSAQTSITPPPRGKASVMFKMFQCCFLLCINLALTERPHFCFSWQGLLLPICIEFKVRPDMHHHQWAPPAHLHLVTQMYLVFPAELEWILTHCHHM